MAFCTVEEAIADVRGGRMIIVVDDEDRENEGDVVMAAEKVTVAALNFMETHARGWICVPMTPEPLQQLDLPLMVDRHTARQQTAFTGTADARWGTTPGLPCSDQAPPIQALVAPSRA